MVHSFEAYFGSYDAQQWQRTFVLQYLSWSSDEVTYFASGNI
jgi:hypothetical protein